MSNLTINLLGPFNILVNGEPPAIRFKSNKVRALLAYLVMDVSRPHHRDTLAGLLWPDIPNKEAIRNLRYALSNLRSVISDHISVPPFLFISRNDIQFNSNSKFTLDVSLFKNALEGLGETRSVKQMEDAVSLFHGDFLDGFSIHDSPIFEEWMMLMREKLTQQLAATYQILADYHTSKRNFQHAQNFAWKQLELDPGNESAHQQLMKILAINGQRSAALAQYHSCCIWLKDYLGVEPSIKTIELFESIRDGRFVQADPNESMNSFPMQYPFPILEESTTLEPLPVFVSRDYELKILSDSLSQALSGKGKILFISGEAGSGKTALVEEFSRRALNKSGDLLLAYGNCNAYTGIGDPYLPFREILDLLSGGFETRFMLGGVDKDLSLRLWNFFPSVIELLRDYGEGLVGTFINRAGLLKRTKNILPNQYKWLEHLREMDDQRLISGINRGELDQFGLFEQFTSVIRSIAQVKPLLLILDDLQWADLGSISLLFHLGRRLSGSRVMVLGTYRSSEINLTNEGSRNPLNKLINEFQSSFGVAVINLDLSDGRDFIEKLLDDTPNKLGVSFRDMLFRQTLGHPLFTLELLQRFQDNEDIIKDQDGNWIEDKELNWNTIPERIEAAIREKFSRIPEELQKILAIASVEGENFTVEVIEIILGKEKTEIVKILSGDLTKKYHWINALTIDHIGTNRISRYRFKSYLFQRYLYNSIDPIERGYLHEKVGNALEDLYEVQISDIVLQLARHFNEAKIPGKAIVYLIKTGELSNQLSAYPEAIKHLSQGLDIYRSLPQAEKDAKLEFELLSKLCIALQAVKGTQSKEMLSACNRAHELCIQTGDKNDLSFVLGHLSLHHYVNANYRMGKMITEELLCIAEEINDPLQLAFAHWILGIILFAMGEFRDSLSHLDQIIDYYDPKKHHKLMIITRGSDAGVSAMAYKACCLLFLGYSEQAMDISTKAINLAQTLGHPFSLADVITYAGCLFNQIKGDYEGLLKRAEQLVEISMKQIPAWLCTSDCWYGEALTYHNQEINGIDYMRRGIGDRSSLNVNCYTTGSMRAIAETLMKLGNYEEAQDHLNKAFEMIKETDEHYCEVDLYRLKAKIHIHQKQYQDADEVLNFAIGIAQRQNNKSGELKVIMDQCKFVKDINSKEEAYHRLSSIYNSFSEGFDTPDLISANELLKLMASSH